ncbi:DUF2157 domain-containing protein [Flavimaricola marinus]|uniref:Uncharacterized protein n=1 Tax=Flavimaricola marinus TaxID=1819565 RepID=A0A238LGE4_9RHOB|nr:DUF2157 domain-containing protein [Flavimaricola marinus]SMY08711.1 hypothetical protein LOM8899_02867 [Flavimaricola marinus]
MSSSIRRYFWSAVVGFALAGLMVALGIWFNVAHLWDVILQADRTVLTVILLWAANGIVFSAVQYGLSAMDGTDDEDDDGPGGGFRQYELRPIPVRRDENRRP